MSIPHPSTKVPHTTYTPVVHHSLMEKIRVNLILGVTQLADLKKRAKAEDISVSRIIRQLVEEYLRREEPKA